VLLAAATPGTIAPTYPLLDYAIGSQKLTSAALNGDPAAEFEVGARYAAGTIVARNTSKAAEWYQRAANGGLAVAKFRLGSLYERGDGVRQDRAAALAWYQRAAEQGNVNAMHNLAVLLSSGDDASTDPKGALKWFLMAAGYGLRDSQYNLGVVYTRGLGTPINLGEAYKWFAIAAASGDSDAGARRDEVGQSLSTSDQNIAKAAAAAWRAKQPSTEANAVAAPPGGWDDRAVTDADRQALVKTIQGLLADQGFDPGPADGRVGPKTTRAIQDYQQKAGVPATGQPDEVLLASLSAAH
jgi:localization factor PodJL